MNEFTLCDSHYDLQRPHTRHRHRKTPANGHIRNTRLVVQNTVPFELHVVLNRSETQDSLRRQLWCERGDETLRFRSGEDEYSRNNDMNIPRSSTGPGCIKTPTGSILFFKNAGTLFLFLRPYPNCRETRRFLKHGQQMEECPPRWKVNVSEVPAA